MKRTPLLFLFSIFILIIVGCGKKETITAPFSEDSIAVFTTADKERDQLSTDDQKELHRVFTWLNRDVVDLLRENGFKTVLLEDMKSYSSSMGPLFIINVEFFNPGVTASLPQGRMGNPVSSLDLSYKLLDERGALLTEWHDGAHSIKGGTYCARTLNRRAVEKITEFFQSR
ncbi:MAG: hypothetical protein KJ630_16850 [Proteobacteria bacterium]|nr:hypothetical protein [Pseudomonadota bacterium]